MSQRARGKAALGGDREARREGDALGVPRAPHLHVRAPALHRGRPVLEPPVLAIAALLIRDGLAEIGSHDVSRSQKDGADRKSG